MEMCQRVSYEAMNETSSFAEYLNTHGSLTYTNVGTSMLPLLWQGTFQVANDNLPNSPIIIRQTAQYIFAKQPSYCYPAIRKHFTDPSIAAAASGIGSGDLVNDLEPMGLFFENLCVRDLRIYADALNGKVYHYRDKNGLECDAVVHLRNGSYGLIEIKLGGDSLIKEGAKTLSKFASDIDTSKMKPPAFKMILTGVGDYAYRRADGICIVPISCLKD